MICYILRGIPGSGKSTHARELIKNGGVVHSTNDHFVKNGRYQFITHLVGWNHHRNFCDFRESIRHKIPIVVVDNCNIRIGEFIHYIEFAEKHWYEVRIVEMPHIDSLVARDRSPHNVPLVNIENMIRDYEPYTL